MLYTSLEAKGESGGFFSSYKKPLVLLTSIAAIVGIILIIVFVLLDHTGNDASAVEIYPFTLDSIFNSSLNPKSYNLRWEASGTSYIYQDPATKDWFRHDLNSTTSLVVNVTELSAAVPNYSSFTFSSDGTLLLVSFNVVAVWRHSYLASYKVYNLATKEVRSLVSGDPLLQNVQWNPVNHQVAYVYQDDIYIVDATTDVAPIQVTSDGDAEEGILNGIQSWVYEEEIFSDFSALWWSPEGRFLAYLRFDESEVPIFHYTLYTGNAYPTEVPLRYPKAGYANPEVELKVFDASNTSSPFPSLSVGSNQTWEYIASVQWSNSALWIQTLNRYQNYSNIVSYSISNNDWASSAPLVHTSSKWIDVYPVTFCNGYNLTILPNGDNYHIASLDALGHSTFWTSGSFDVISLVGCGAGGKVFYHATPTVDAAKPIAATLQYIYTIDTTSHAVNQINQGEGVFSASSFSPAGNYFVVSYLGPNIPKVFLLSTDLTVNVTLQDNKDYEEIIKHYNFPEKVFTTVKGAGDNVLNAYYKKPITDDESLPLIIDVYAGPGTQRVQQIHKVGGLDAWLAINGYVVAAIDGRGTGRRGLNFLQQTYKQLGLLEIADQRAGAKELAKMNLINDKRVAIWGWSFGGFMAAHGIAGTSDIDGFSFKAAVSVAPVSDWRFYDSVYTERFMSTPADNPAGYNATSVLKHAQNTPAHKLLLMHGTGDDNVHFQNTVELANVLINSNVQFDTMFYPNDDHSINSGNARRYLYERLTQFLESEL